MKPESSKPTTPKVIIEADSSEEEESSSSDDEYAAEADELFDLFVQEVDGTTGDTASALPPIVVESPRSRRTSKIRKLSLNLAAAMNGTLFAESLRQFYSIGSRINLSSSRPGFVRHTVLMLL